MIFYRKYQDQSEDTKRSGMWYARAVQLETVDTRSLSKKIEANVSVKRSDVIAVLAELSNVIKDELASGKRVRLDDIGAFKVGINTKPAQTSDKFTAAENISNIHLIFQPETYKSSNGHRTKRWLDDVKVTELPKNFVVDE
ncbi:MAG: HU family DNA-binding protein [Prevotella sp.]|nr:HU family DNA-binding protein [Prevotella sp.]